MRIVAAQLRPVGGDVAANLAEHLAVIDRAARCGADLIFFPELSLTGYEPRLAASLAMDAGDPRLDVFQQLSERHELVVGVGLPLRSAAGVQIGMVFFRPGSQRTTYAKRHLHEDELPYFVQGAEPVLLQIRSLRLAPAICYESLLAAHAAEAAGLGTDIYLASVAKPQGSLQRALLHFPDIARRHRLQVVMVNSVGPCDDFISAGGSAAWNHRGELQACLGNEHAGSICVEYGADGLETVRRSSAREV